MFLCRRIMYLHLKVQEGRGGGGVPLRHAWQRNMDRGGDNIHLAATHVSTKPADIYRLHPDWWCRGSQAFISIFCVCLRLSLCLSVCLLLFVISIACRCSEFPDPFSFFFWHVADVSHTFSELVLYTQQNHNDTPPENLLSSLTAFTAHLQHNMHHYLYVLRRLCWHKVLHYTHCVALLPTHIQWRKRISSVNFWLRTESWPRT